MSRLINRTLAKVFADPQKRSWYRPHPYPEPLPVALTLTLTLTLSPSANPYP